MAGVIQADYLQPTSSAGLTILTPSGNTVASINTSGVFSTTGSLMLSANGTIVTSTYATLTANTIQIGQSGSSSNNFTLYQPSTPDGTVRLGNGNAGSVTDLITVTSAGKMGIGTSSTTNARLTVGGTVGLITSATRCVQVADPLGGVLLLGKDNTDYSGLWHDATNQRAQWLYRGGVGVTLDSSGNLGLGVTPSAWSAYKAVQVGYGALASTAATQNTLLSSNVYYDAGGSFRYIASDYASYMQQYAGAFIWKTASSGTAGNAISFTQAMTLDASGNLLVGDTSGPTNARFYAVHSVSSAGVGFIRCASTSYTDSVFTVSSATASGTGFNLLRLQHATGTCCQVLGNGNVQNTNNSYGAISDKSLKENIVDATPKLANLLRVKIRNFNLIGDSTKQIGVVAQELEEVFPAMVEEDGDGVKSVKYSVFVPMLVKAIQELSDELNIVKSELAELKSRG